jgi:hypothetical protein
VAEQTDFDGGDDWADYVGDDAELDRLWAAMTQAVGVGQRAEITARLAAHLGSLGARGRRISQGLILAAAAARGEPSEEPDWRVTLHRHFVEDERIDLDIATDAMMAQLAAAATPDWHSRPGGVSGRVLGAFMQDIRDSLSDLEAAEDAPERAAEAALLHELTSQLFDYGMSLETEALEELHDDPALPEALNALLATANQVATGLPDSTAEVVRAAALLEVSIRQLQLD